MATWVNIFDLGEVDVQWIDQNGDFHALADLETLNPGASWEISDDGVITITNASTPFDPTNNYALVGLRVQPQYACEEAQIRATVTDLNRPAAAGSAGLSFNLEAAEVTELETVWEAGEGGPHTTAVGVDPSTDIAMGACAPDFGEIGPWSYFNSEETLT